MARGRRSGLPNLPSRSEDSDTEISTADLDLLEEMRAKFDRAQDYEATARSRHMEDYKFAMGDSENGYQWPVEVKKNRDVDRTPTLTINSTRQFCLNIINECRQFKSAIKIDPVGDTASYDGAQVMTGIIRHIENASRAENVYDVANERQVYGGWGYWRVITQYVDQNSLDQELRIAPIKDPMSVLLDPDAQQKDKSDMNFAFIFENVPKDQFDFRYPKYKDLIGNNYVGDLIGWNDQNYVRVCEYYYRKSVSFELVVYVDPRSGQVKSARKDEINDEDLWKELLAIPTARTRKVDTYEVEWYKVAGDVIVDRRTKATGNLWKGTTIPLVKIFGEEVIIEGKFDCKGHVRYLKDPNRMYNYWSSGAVTQVALQTKIPWKAPARAIENFEEYWKTANTSNHSILPWNDLDEEGHPIAAPERVNPPIMSAAYLQGMQVAREELRMASGQYHEDMGQETNAQSGIAIQQRVRQSNLSTQHFIENQAVGLAYTGRILVEMIPHIYDTKRIIRILGETGDKLEVMLDPTAEKEYVKDKAADQAKAQIIFNPGFGKYSVVVEAGPNYATRRQEAFNALAQILQGNPQLIQMVGDLLFRAADFPMADEVAERLKRAVPPYLLGEGPNPESLQVQQELAATKQALASLVDKAADLEREKRQTEQLREIEKYRAQANEQERDILRSVEEFRAETDRIKVLLGQISPEQIAQIVMQTVMPALGIQLPDAQNAPTAPSLKGNSGGSGSAPASPMTSGMNGGGSE